MGTTENKGTLEDQKHVTAALLRQASVSHLENVGRQVRRVDNALQLRFNGCLPRSVILLEACKLAHNATGNLMVDFVQLKHNICKICVAGAIGRMIIDT